MGQKPKEEKASIIAELRGKCSTLYESSPDCDPDTFVIFRPATRIEYNTYRQQRDSDASRYDADYTLGYATVVYPDRAGLDAIYDRIPAFASSLAVDIIHQSGGLKSSVKKL